MDALIQDVRYAILTLALGIGANSAIFSPLNAVLMKLVPYRDPDRLMAFVTRSPQGSLDRASPTKFNAWRTCDAFEHVSAYRFSTANVTNGEEAEQVPIGQVSAHFFDLFGAPFIKGRTLSADEDRSGGAHAAVLSFGYWHRRFGGDAEMIGKKISIGGAPYTVIGILGPTFQMRGGGSAAGPVAAIPDRY